MERVTGVEPVFRPWQGRIIAAIRYPQIFNFTMTNSKTISQEIQSLKKNEPNNNQFLGGLVGNRTRLRGFADRCLTSRPPGQKLQASFKFKANL